MNELDVANNIAEVLKKIRNAEKQYQRNSGAVDLLAVSKQQPVEKIKKAISVGQFAFGENYLQEALPKIELLQDTSACWHFIGRVQTNKAKLIAEHFSWVHTVSSMEVAQRLNDARSEPLGPLNVCIQINISAEPSKSGVLVEQLVALISGMLQLQRLHLRGFMVIPRLSHDVSQQLAVFKQVAALKERWVGQGIALDTLSMGMSRDYEVAIAAGSTLVRIGSAIFGPR